MSMFTTIPTPVIVRVAELREAGATFAAIAAATGLPERVCQYHSAKAGALHPDFRPLNPVAEYRRGSAVVRAFSPAEDAQILAWAMELVPNIEMGRRLGRQHNSIIGRLRTLGNHEASLEGDV